MTSLAFLPTVKRTITDVMDEDLYHLPNSPIQFPQVAGFGSNTASSVPGGNHGTVGAGSQGYAAQHAHQQHEEMAKANRGASVQSSPSLSNSQLYGGGSIYSNSSLADSFAEQYSKYNVNLNNLGTETASNAYNDAFYEMGMDNSQAKINPFNDYGNPDTQINSYIRPQEISMPNPVNRRRRITTLETPDSNTKPLKEEDYLLFNPDIQPSHLINNRSFFDDFSNGSMCVPNERTNFTNEPIPGFENDYLLMDDFDEEVEADLSDDEDDNYFNDDGDFDDLIMHDNAVMDIENYFTPNEKKEKGKEELCGGFLDYHKVNEDDLEGVNSDMSDKSGDSMMVDNTSVTDESPSIQLEKESPQPYSDDNADSHHYKTAAEISANNPNHQCELVNSATGQPCNKQFSRPYDLVRHQETIHAEKKKIFRCVICEGRLNGGSGNGKSKTFSRGDALSRHVKVKHGLVGKEALDIINEAKANVEYVHV